MSLQVWLPLNGDLNNQGLNNLVAINNGATINNNGKIGKCYQLGTAASDISLPAAAMTTNTTECSMCLWINILTWNTTYATFFQAGPASTSWTSYIFGLLRNNTASTCCFTISNGSSASNASYLTPAFDLNKWYHIVLVYKTGHCLIYINGQLHQDYTTSIVPNFAGITTIKLGRCANGSSYQTNCLMNDFRIYNHALSAKEVEEIAKGLVLHYKLDNYWLAENLLINTHFDNRYSQTTGWDTSKNGTLLANSWGGYNSGVANQATVYHAHLKEVNGEYVYEYIKDANNSWLGIAQSGLQSKLTAGTKYTFSWEQYCVSGSNYVNTGLYYYKTGASSAGFHLGYAYGNSGRVTSQWQKFTYTFTAPSDADYAKSMSWYVYGAQGGNGTFYARHFKLEKGDKATPWSPAKTDTLYTALEYNSATIYDSSGYANNGTIVGSLTAAVGSPRYNVATFFNNNPYIKITDFNYTSNTWSVSCWFKKTSTITDFETMLGLSRGNGSDANKKFSIYIKNTAVGFVGEAVAHSSILTIDKTQWHHVCVTSDGNVHKYYLDGVLKNTFSNTANLIDCTDLVIGGRAATTNAESISTSWGGNISDVRIYATPLTLEQIIELYNTSMIVDSNNNMLPRELV